MRTARRLIVLLCVASLLSACFGCGWAGQTAGKAQAKLERQVDDFERGYEKGHETEKSKTQ